MGEFTYDELEVELLPSREALNFFGSNFAGVQATNLALAQNVGSAFSAATAVAGQVVIVKQS
jgi:hypothetical protein